MTSVVTTKYTVSTIRAPSIFSIIAAQLGAVLVLAIAGLLLSGVTTALSLALGGLVCWVANTVFTIKAFKYRGASATEKIVKEFATGEALKILLSGAGFALVFIYVSAASPLLVFLGYIGVYLVGLVSTWAALNAYNRSSRNDV